MAICRQSRSIPVLSDTNQIEWYPNLAYRASPLDVHPARKYPELDLLPNCGLYRQFTDSPDSIMWVSDPSRKEMVWNHFIP